MAGIGNMLCSRPKQVFKVGRSDHGFFVRLYKTLGRLFMTLNFSKHLRQATF